MRLPHSLAVVRNDIFFIEMIVRLLRHCVPRNNIHNMTKEVVGLLRFLRKLAMTCWIEGGQ